ncbi:MAG: RpiB/LacA/LacB family sugar-phosphate isomerase [Caldilineales bacterium]|nr:RpiB/LacA/LacB family sugar-phosphate isomerase [Caldilineales bacterium]
MNPDPQPAPRRVITAAEIAALPPASVFVLPAGARLTALAQEEAAKRGIVLQAGAHPDSAAAQRGIAIAADHGGFALKEALKPFLVELGYDPVDLGTHSAESVDYPDFALAAAGAVAQGRCVAGIVIDGAGIGSCMAANKVPGVRASLCYDLATARNAREHNHANLLTLGAGLISPDLARQIVRTWLQTPWGGDRHARRVAKITAIEQRFTRTDAGR